MDYRDPDESLLICGKSTGIFEIECSTLLSNVKTMDYGVSGGLEFSCGEDVVIVKSEFQ